MIHTRFAMQFQVARLALGIAIVLLIAIHGTRQWSAGISGEESLQFDGQCPATYLPYVSQQQ